MLYIENHQMECDEDRGDCSVVTDSDSAERIPGEIQHEDQGTAD